jgi:hypothetical protein
MNEKIHLTTNLALSTKNVWYHNLSCQEQVLFKKTYSVIIYSQLLIEWGTYSPSKQTVILNLPRAHESAPGVPYAQHPW